MSTRLRAATGWSLCILAANGCTIITDFSSDRALERSEERCSDRVDNDGNGLTDCQDPSCKIFDFCNETSEARCSDGIDNDADGSIDCKDMDCCSQARCASEPACGERTVAACTDARDNDLNGLTDCADFSCAISQCCSRPLPIVAETFDAGASSCAPLDCSSASELCCSKAAISCNPLDPARWLSWGNPSPRLVGGELTPNQPCPACPVSGIVSISDAELAPHLYLELELNLRGDLVGSMSAGLVHQAVLPATSLSASCGGVQAPYSLLAGFSVEAGQVAAVVGGAVRATAAATPQGRQRLALEVTANGSLRFTLDGRLLHEAAGAVVGPYPRVRLLVQGHSAIATVDNLLLARRVGCGAPGRWLAGPRGPTTVLSPPVESEGRFDASSITDPSLLWVQQGLRLYYAGTSAKAPGQSKLGLALSSDGQTWTLAKEPIVIVGEDAPALSGPTVMSRAPVGAGFLMAYTARSGDGTSRIGLAESVDGIAWKRAAIAVERGAAGRWDDDEVAAPALCSYRHQLHLYYAGRGKSSPLPALGLALAPELAGGAAPSFSKLSDPVLRPGVGTHDERGVTDPALLVGENVLHLYYLGLSWGGGTQINLCASEDGRNWVRHPQNPMISVGAPPLFGAELHAPSLIDRWGTIRLWYGATSPAGLPSIGYAENPVTSP